jgi:hypothetical protein
MSSGIGWTGFRGLRTRAAAAGLKRTPKYGVGA